MIPFLASAAVALGGVSAATSLAWLAGLPRRNAAPGRYGWHDLARLVAGLAALPLLVGGTDGDVMVGSVLAAVTVTRASPMAAVALVGVGAVAALRVGSPAASDIGAAHAVLGPALTSPSTAVAAAAALGGLAALAAAAAAVNGASSPSLRRLVRSPAALADALGPLIAVLLAALVSVGPPLANGSGSEWSAAGGLVIVGALPTAALLRRAIRTGPVPVLAIPSAALSGAAAVLALAAR